MTGDDWHDCPVCGADTKIDMTPFDAAAIRECTACEWSVEIPHKEVAK